MFKRILAPAMVGFLLAAGMTEATAAPQPPTLASGEEFEAAIAEGRYDDALGMLDAIQAHPNFRSAQPQMRATVLLLRGGLLVELQRREEAIEAFREAALANPEASEAWFSLLELVGLDLDHTAMARVLTEAVQRSPRLREEIVDDYVYFIAQSEEVPDDVAFELRAALFDYGWRARHDDGIWFRHLNDLMERDDDQRALAVVREIESPSGQARLLAARRYDGLREAAGLTEPDFTALTLEDLERDRAAAAETGAPLSARLDLSTTLMDLGHYEEVLAVTEAGLASLESDDASEDWSTQTWLMNYRSRALMELGRHDEALLEQQRAAGRLENGGRNISQTINLGWTYLRLGRSEEAMTAVAGMVAGDDISAYGVMQAVQVRACAAHALGDTTTVEASMAHLSGNWDDAPGAYLEALACVGDIDGMAELTIRRLGDPDHVDQALADLHDYLEPGVQTEHDRRVRAALIEMRSRDDVIAARDAVGRQLTLPTRGSQF